MSLAGAGLLGEKADGMQQECALGKLPQQKKIGNMYFSTEKLPL